MWDGERLSGLNASGVAPAAWNVDYFRKRHGEAGNGIANKPTRGWDTVTVPGVIAGWEALHAKFGSLPFADLLEPAIEIAERGYAVPPIVAHKWAAAVPELKGLPGFADTFMPHGRAPQVGERVCLPGHAQTLRTLQKEGARAFYEGRSPSASPRSPAKAGARWPQPTCRLTGPNGSSRSASASAVTRSTRFRRTGRASPR